MKRQTLAYAATIVALWHVPGVVWAQDKCTSHGEEALLQGRELFNGGAYAEAVICLDRAAEYHELPLDYRGAALNMAGESYRKQSLWTEALNRLSRAVHLSPSEQQQSVADRWLETAKEAARVATPDDDSNCAAIRDTMQSPSSFVGEEAFEALAACYQNSDNFDGAIRALRQAEQEADSTAASQRIQEKVVRYSLAFADSNRGDQGRRCEVATELLETRLSHSDREEAEQVKRRACGELEDEEEEVEDEEEEDEEPFVPYSPPPESSGTIFDTVFLVAGAVTVGTGVITGILALKAQGELKDLCPDRKCADEDLEDADDIASRIDTLGLATDVLLVSGLSMLALGWILSDDDDERHAFRRETPTLMAGCGQQGCLGALRTRF